MAHGSEVGMGFNIERTNKPFVVKSPYKPSGDQPKAIEELAERIENGENDVVLMGATGTGKTATTAWLIERLQRPTLIIEPNKTLAAQLCAEFRELMPDNAVSYFVSYYDYYQPEAYIPQTDTYIEKDSNINDDVERLRHAATANLLTRRDCVVVATVSCIYGLGTPEEYAGRMLFLEEGQQIDRDDLLRTFVAMQYKRNDIAFTRGTFRVRGDVVDVYPPYAEHPLRFEFFGDEVELIAEIDEVTGEMLREYEAIPVWPASHYVTEKPKVKAALKSISEECEKRVAELKATDKLLEAQRLQQRTDYDLEMLETMGFCNGIENYSRYFDGRAEGTRPFCLIDYFPKDYMLVVDESHVTLPQVHAMYGGDRARKENLVEYGFRLPAAKDNRPVTFAEFEQLQGTSIYVSATPADYELMKSEGVIVEQLIRPTGLVDPPLEVRVTLNQIDDLIGEIDKRVKNDDKVLVTTITKRMAEELSKYFDRVGVRNRYIHSDVDTLERIQILEDLRAGMFDVLVGVNLLREGLDLPEVALVAILDADKEGFLRNVRSLTQIAGRAARHSQGNVILYADTCTDSMRYAIEQSNRRREKQVRYNMEHEMLPRQAQKSGSGQSALLAGRVDTSEVNMTAYPIAEDHYAAAADVQKNYTASENIDALIDKAREEMERAAKSLDFLAAAKFRDRMYELQKLREENRNQNSQFTIHNS